MDGASDPFSSVSFLDLLACSLCVAIILLIFAGGNDDSPATEQRLHVLQIDDQLMPPYSRVDTDRNPFNVLALRVGDYMLVSQEDERPCWNEPLTHSGETCRGAGPGGQRVAIVESDIRGCIGFRGPIVPLRQLVPTTPAFHWRETAKFASEVEATYGVKVDVGALMTEPQRFSLTLTRDSTAQGSGPEVQIAYRLARGRPSELTIWTLDGQTSRSTSRTFAGGTASQEFPGRIFGRTGACIVRVAPNGDLGPRGAIATLPILLLSLPWSAAHGPHLHSEEMAKSHETDYPTR